MENGRWVIRRDKWSMFYGYLWRNEVGDPGPRSRRLARAKLPPSADQRITDSLGIGMGGLGAEGNVDS